MSALLVAGTTSDAGKSIVTTGLCRAIARRGLSVAPYKAQNMSNNSMVCADGSEIGRAQWVQALAAQVEPEAAINPVLLKPGSDHQSHVVLMGRPAGDLDASNFADGRSHLAEAVFAAFDDLAQRFELIVCEGAGSPAEINLRSSDYVNMGLARHGDIPTIVVGDIDRGGVLAALFGTVALLEAADQRLVAGFIVNKFRGNADLLEPGLRQIEALTRRRVFGVLPWHAELWLDSEDSIDVGGWPRTGYETLRVAVVRFPRVSNFTDVDALALEPDVAVSFVTTPRQLAGADVVVLPGSRATVADLAWMREQGLDVAVAEHAAAGRPVLGICGGLQMLGTSIADPQGVEGSSGVAQGLGLLDVATTFGVDKVLDRPTGVALGQPVSGYEIHHGRLDFVSGEEFAGGARSGSVFGTMWHGTLESDGFRRAFLTQVAQLAGCEYAPSSVVFGEARERRLELLADLMEEHLDVDALISLAADGPPGGVPALSPGADYPAS